MRKAAEFRESQASRSSRNSDDEKSAAMPFGWKMSFSIANSLRRATVPVTAAFRRTSANPTQGRVRPFRVTSASKASLSSRQRGVQEGERTRLCRQAVRVTSGIHVVRYLDCSQFRCDSLPKKHRNMERLETTLSREVLKLVSYVFNRWL
jgi:hypothetical protein